MRHPLFSDKERLLAHTGLPDLPRKLPYNTVGDEVAFITGATGFIAGHLLCTMIKSGQFKKYICLVRGDNSKQAGKRLYDSLKAKGASDEELGRSNITVIVGDSLVPMFGIDKSLYEQLSGEVDHVFHFAASMNWVVPFGPDATANIEGLKMVLSFCAERRLKKLHYASSMGLWTILNHSKDPIYEDHIHQNPDELPGGYFQSKWVNEVTLIRAAEMGLPVNVYRIGDVKGDARTGWGDPHNFGNLVMNYFVQNGVVIEKNVPEFNFLPVDFLADAIAYISMQHDCGTFQFSNPELISFCDIYDSACRVGHACRLIDHEQWLHIIRSDKRAAGRKLNAIFRTFTPGAGYESQSFYSIGVKMFQRVHDITNTKSLLENTDIRCPGMLKDAVLDRYMARITQINSVK